VPEKSDFMSPEAEFKPQWGCNFFKTKVRSALECLIFTSLSLVGIMLFGIPLFITIMLGLVPAYCFQLEQRLIQAHSTPLGIPWQGKHKVNSEGMDTDYFL
jgi:hypothetical protein